MAMRCNQRGVALIAVLLVLLVLTILGITASVMMTQEDRTSSRQDLQRAALYVAEAGLRRGESVLNGISVFAIGQLLNHTTTTANPAVNPPVPTPPPPWDAQHLGTYLTTVPGGGVEISREEVALSGAGATGGRQAFYAVYVRPAQNAPNALRLLSVGWLETAGTPLAVKILEEEIDYAGILQNVSVQKQVNAGGTGSGQFGG